MIANLDIAQLTTQERLDLIGELWDSLASEDIRLTPTQEAELIRHMEVFDLYHDLWAKPYIDEALAEVERGEIVTFEEAEAHLNERFGKLAD